MKQEKYQPDDEINLRDYTRAIWKRRVFILSLFLLAVIIAGVFSLISPKVYKVDAILEIGTISENPIDSLTGLVEEIEGGRYKNTIREALNIKERDYPAIKVEVPKDTQLLKLEIETKDIGLAKEILNKQIELILTEHQERMEKRVQVIEENIEEIQSTLNLLIAQKIYSDQGIADLRLAISELREELDAAKPTNPIKPPTVSGAPIKPRPLRNIVIAGALGLFFGVFLAISREWLEGPKET